MLTLAVLGPVEVRRDGVVTRVPGGKARELLVRLALEAGAPVRAERLLGDLWPAQVHAAAPNTLQSKVSRLRRALGDPSVLHGDDAGYTLMVDPLNVDAIQVLGLAEQAVGLRASADPQGALEVCEQGLALFHGDVLPAAADAVWANPYRVRLEATRLRLVEEHLSAKVDLGAAEELVADLEDLVVAYPLRERGWTLLVTALYRAGRQGDALAAFRRVRLLLADELGIDPGPELQRLEQMVLAQDPALAVARRQATASRARPGVGNVTPPMTSLVGRQGELERVEDSLRERRLVTLTGPAGVGKTRLAVEVASRSDLPGGAWLAHLETATDAVSVWRSIGEALAIDAPTQGAVTERLAATEVLMVLDNCEHVIEAVAETVGTILSAAPSARVLATSQVPLHSAAESVIDLEPLTLSDSVALFTDRAAAQRPEQPDEDSPATVEAVCRSLDGLPLAIELAAARTKVLPIHEIARRLEDRFALLRDPTSRLPPRHTTLRAAVEWSYSLLFPDDQRGLWALAAFTGGAPLTALEAVLEALQVPRDAGLDIISRLVDRSLATADIRSRGPARYHLLDSVRAFSRERLHEEGLAEAAAAAHADWLAAAADRANIGVRGPAQPEHLDLARTERANIDSALAWCAAHDPHQGVQIALGFGWTWAVLGAGVEGADRVRAALAAASPSAQEQAAGLTLCGWFEASGGNLERAASDLQDAIRVGDDRAGAVARLYLAFVHTQGGRAADALALLDACRGDLTRLTLAWEEGVSWLLSAWAHIATGDIVAGEAACDRAFALLRPLGDNWALGHAAGLLGELAQAQGRYAEAAVHLAGAAEAAAASGFDAAQAHHRLNLGRVQQQSGDPTGSTNSLLKAIALGQGCGDARTVALARTRLAQVSRDAGDLATAREQVARAVAWFTTAGGGDGALLADFLMITLLVGGDASGTHGELVGLLHRARSAADPVVEVLTLDALAAADVRDGHPDEARSRLEEADTVAASVRTVWPGDRVDGQQVRHALSAVAPVTRGVPRENRASPPSA
ncbi:winged helix-turn-helix domain-containing protein [Knoellia locipacati]|uniref:BTAD domain-containing putative transcriptional regulator n=1 Tax=Knoellia locipacati TaxID=882824 RepID=UPI0038502268